MTLWQVRTRVRDIPGKLAQLATALSAVRGNVVGIDVLGRDLGHVHDDLFVDVPETVDAGCSSAAWPRVEVRGEPVSAVDLHSAVLRGEAAVRAWARSTAR